MNPMRTGLCLVLFMAAAASAAEGESAETFNIFGGSLLASVVAVAVFLAMVAILGKTAYPKILAGLKVREEQIEYSLKAAEKAAQETQRVTAELEAKMLAARAEASKLIEKSKEDAQLVAQTELEKVRGEIKLERDRAQREIKIAKDTALQEIVDKAADWSVALAAKIVQEEVSPEKHRELIAQAMNQLRRPEQNN